MLSGAMGDLSRSEPWRPHLVRRGKWGKRSIVTAAMREEEDWRGRAASVPMGVVFGADGGMAPLGAMMWRGSAGEGLCPSPDPTPPKATGPLETDIWHWAERFCPNAAGRIQLVPDVTVTMSSGRLRPVPG